MVVVTILMCFVLLTYDIADVGLEEVGAHAWGRGRPNQGIAIRTCL